MQMVIEIPEHIYTKLADIKFGGFISEWVFDCVKKGIPLPKGHGRLIDEYQIVIPYDICDGEEAMEFVHDAPTIIEADRDGGNDNANNN